jgi:hypothetical protein
MDHPGSQAPIEALNDWQAGDANLFALLARILDLDWIGLIYLRFDLSDLSLSVGSEDTEILVNRKTKLDPHPMTAPTCSQADGDPLPDVSDP